MPAAAEVVRILGATGSLFGPGRPLAGGRSRLANLSRPS